MRFVRRYTTLSLHSALRCLSGVIDKDPLQRFRLLDRAEEKAVGVFEKRAIIGGVLEALINLVVVYLVL